MKKLLTYLIFFPLLLQAQEWQWSTEIKTFVSGETNAHPEAFLWIPPTCNQVRGVVVGMHNMQEEGIMEHPHFRKVMEEIGFAEIWVTPGLDPLYDTLGGTHLAFDEMLSSLAEISGYTELAYAPIVPIGHSAYASYPWNFGAWNPDRTLAMLSIHGDAPQTHLTGCGRPNLDWGARNINGIPGLMVMGEYEWWEDRLFSALKFRKEQPEVPVSLLADAGHGHFDHSEMLIRYLAMFIQKAAHYRLPENMSMTQQTKMKPVNAKHGWLADRWHPDQSKPVAKAAIFEKYKGNKEQAFWYFDREMAHETEKYYARARGKKSQYIGVGQTGKLLLYNEKSHARYNIKFQPEYDGLTFHLSAMFTDSLKKETSEQHAKNGKINIDRICGPVMKINDTTFTVRFYRMGLNNPKRTGDIWLLAHHEGDATYKSTVQQLNIRIPHRNTEGIPQAITFQEIPNIQVGTKSITLNAVSDSGLPVYFFVKEGPAEIIDGKLVLTKIPPRAKFPLKVTVTAWQYGKTTEPKVQTAESVTQTFMITE